MKYIKIFEEFKEGELTKEQREWLDSVVLGNWVVNAQGKIDVEGTVFCVDFKQMKRLPVKFGKVSGGFNSRDCSSLETLEGSPEEVGDGFSVAWCTSLKTLEGAPKIVKGSFLCYECDSLISLQGAPEKVGKYFYCDNCVRLTTLEGAPREVGDTFNCNECHNLTTLKGAPTVFKAFRYEHLPKVPQAELDLLELDKKLFIEWLKSDKKPEHFLHQKRGTLKGREFGF